MPSLRPYQEKAIEAVDAALARGVTRPLIVLPTGTGKTVMFAALIARRGGSALVLAHRDELLTQAGAKLAAADPALAMSMGRVQAARNDVNAPVVLASVQTLASHKRLEQLPRTFDTVIVDEAHHAAAASYLRVLDHLSESPLIVGVTATPMRADGEALSQAFTEVVYEKHISEMIRAGYLCDIRGVRVGIDCDLARVPTTNGDLDAGKLGKALAAANAPQHVVVAYQAHAQGRKAIVFTPTVELAHEQAAMFRYGGIDAEALDGETPKLERAAILKRFDKDETRVLVNVGVLTEGVDVPSVDCIILARPTKSQALYAQCVGRGLRTLPGKTDCLIIDVVGATERLDLQTLPDLLGHELDDGESALEALEGPGAPRPGAPEAEGEMIARATALLAADYACATPGCENHPTPGESMLWCSACLPSLVAA